MAIAIDREEAGDINNPSFDVINWCVNQHEKEIPRLQMLFDYYDGKPHKIGEKGEVKTPQEKDEIYVNNAKYVTDMMVGFSVGSPISYTAPKGYDIKLILSAYDRMRIQKHDKELAKDISVYGVGLELQYLAFDPTVKAANGEPQRTMPKIACIDPRGMFLVVDDTVERTKLFAVRRAEKETIKGDKYWEFNIYCKQVVITYYSKSKELSWDNMIRDEKINPHYYKDVPVTEYRNNEEKQGDFEQQISQIDGYNKLQTDRIRDKENFIKAIMIFYGFSLPEDKPDEINGSIAVNAPSKQDGASAEFLTNTFDESGIQVLAKSLLEDFHKTSYVPNLNDEKFGGNATGVSMKYKLFGLLLVLATKIGYMEDGLIQRLQLTANILNTKGQDMDVEGTIIKFKPNLPVDRKDVIEQIRDSREFIPLLVSLGWLDDVDDPEEIIKMLDEEKEKTISMNQKAMGTMNSHSDVEPDEEDEDNDTGENQ